MAETLRSRLRESAPDLTKAIDELCQEWLGPLEERLGKVDFRPKQINDAVWGTIELLPWEVALLDTPMLQRMRGVRQLGLAHLVFPGAVHDRLEHILGVVGAVDLMADALQRHAERWNREPRNRSRQLPVIEQKDRHRLRLAALFHDLGHGPFSHAIEPVLQVVSPLGTPEVDGRGWREDIERASKALTQIYATNGSPSVSEVLAAMIVTSDPVGRVLASDELIHGRWASGQTIQEELVACILGAIDGPGADHLSALISSQLDADRTDYLSRDAHHAGLAIGFDTGRLLSRLEILQMRQDNTPGADDATRQRIAKGEPDPTLQVGIAASGFGSFEQMLIGRTFLYDRLYHHHKVRAAEAMAQRMLLVAERDRASRFDLKEIFLSVGDDTLVRILAEEVTHAGFATKSKPASRLARGLLDRNLLHRAYAFRARLVSTPPGLGQDAAEEMRNEQWLRLLKSLDKLSSRYEFGEAIWQLACEAAKALQDAGIDADNMKMQLEALEESGPEGIIVDVPSRKADAIRIWARYPDGTLKVPEFSFNPVKWADAYDLQKRTGYVFCQRETVPVVALASSIVFLSSFSLVMSRDADGYTKAAQTVNQDWLPQLVHAGLIDQAAADQLASKRYSLLTLRIDDLSIPEGWIAEDPDFGTELLVALKQQLSSGLTADDLKAFTKTSDAMFHFVEMWMAGEQVSGEVSDEADLQRRLRDHLRSSKLHVEEGSVAGGGKLDLFVEKSVLIENKFKNATSVHVTRAAPAAGAQGRRYAVALRSQVVFTVAAARVRLGDEVPQRTGLVEVRSPSAENENRVEIRFTVPFGAVTPSGETEPKQTA